MNHPTTFLKISPILPSTDVERDIKWYEEKLGFQLGYNSGMYEEGPIINYAVLHRQGISIHLQFQYPKDMAQMNGSQLRIEVKNIQPLFEEYSANGVVKELREKTPWGTNEFGFFDLNKNGIFFFEDLK